MVKHGVICQGKPELQAYAWKLAPMQEMFKLIEY